MLVWSVRNWLSFQYNRLLELPYWVLSVFTESLPFLLETALGTNVVLQQSDEKIWVMIISEVEYLPLCGPFSSKDSCSSSFHTHNLFYRISVSSGFILLFS